MSVIARTLHPWERAPGAVLSLWSKNNQKKNNPQAVIILARKRLSFPVTATVCIFPELVQSDLNAMNNFICLSRGSCMASTSVNLLKPTGHVMHQQFNIQQLYALPTLCLCALYLSENKQRLVPLTA